MKKLLTTALFVRKLIQNAIDWQDSHPINIK